MKKANLKVAGDRVLATRLEKAGMTKGGIALPDNTNDKTARAKIVDPGKTALKFDETVVFHADAGTDVTDKDGNEYIVLDFDDILAIEI